MRSCAHSIHPFPWRRAGLAAGSIVSRPSLRLVASVLALTALGAAFPQRAPADSPPSAGVHAGSVKPPHYLIQPGDELGIRFFHTPQLDQDLRVRPDGFVSMPLATRVKAAGRTAEEVAADIVRQVGAELREPEVAVIVRTFSAHVVHVGGEVRRPGIVELTAELTVLRAVAAAGGALDSARLKSVLVLRPLDDGGHRVLRVNLRRVLNGTDLGADIPLRPRDAVYLPKSRIANVNLWAKQYIWENLPLRFRVATLE